MANKVKIELFAFSEIGQTIDDTLVTLQNYTSYMNVVETDAILNSHPFSSSWRNCSDSDTKKRAIIGAGWLLDRLVIPHEKTNRDQNLEFPRRGLIDPSKRSSLGYNSDVSQERPYGYFLEDELPKFWKQAVAELALDIVNGNDRFKGQDPEHVSGGGFGNVSVDVTMRSTEEMPDAVLSIIENVFSRNRGYGHPTNSFYF